MILNFLQTRNPPVLPCLHSRPHQRLIGPDGKHSAFADDIITLRTFGHKNKETLGELLFHFFRRYAHELDYEKYVISIRAGTLISKEAKKWHLMQNNRLCVEEPFNIERNLGNTADDISFRGVHLELRRAFDLVCEAKLEECMEQYIFPAVEEKIWEKPPSKPPPILTPSHPLPARGGRGGFGNRGARHASNQHRVGPQGRRASSATASNRFPSSHIVTQALATSKHPLQAQYEQLQLHDQLINEYQFLQAQEHELRLAQAQAQLLQVQGSNQMSLSGPHSARDQPAPSTMNPQPPMSAPLQHAHSIYPYPLHPHSLGPVQAVHTNPSSPSMKPVQPVQPELRRRIHRSNPASVVSSASLRSHSQPARPYPMPVALQNSQALLLNGYTLQQLRQQHQMYQQMEAQGRLRPPEVQNQLPFHYDPRYEDNLPKEYVGYYVHDSPPHRRIPGDNTVHRPHAYNDMSYGKMGSSNGHARFNDLSRSPSPSPLIPSRDRSTSVRSALSAPPDPIATDQSATSSRFRTSGPIIVDGSDAYSADHQDVTDMPVERGSRDEGNSKHGSYMEGKGTARDVLSRRSGRSESIFSDSGQQQPPWPLPQRENPLFLDHNRGSNHEPMRRPYPQVNGTAPAPPTMRYSGALTNGHGSGVSDQGNLHNPPVASSPEDLPEDEGSHSLPVAKSEASSDPAKVSYDQPLKALPLLSPVREVRTPSPTANRKEDVAVATRSSSRLAQRYQLQDIPPFCKGTHGKQKQSEPLTEKSNGQIMEAPTSPQADRQLGNGWQQTISKKGKKQKSKSGTALLANTSTGETVPENVAERKGG